MFDRAHCIWGQAGIVASICRLDLSNVDMADDIVMYGHILSHNIPETKKKIVKTSSKKLVKKFVKKFIKKFSFAMSNFRFHLRIAQLVDSN